MNRQVLPVAHSEANPLSSHEKIHHAAQRRDDDDDQEPEYPAFGSFQLGISYHTIQAPHPVNGAKYGDNCQHVVTRPERICFQAYTYNEQKVAKNA
ncbi:hypothetical protein OCK74_12225 [Chitinophagaceae bacterium LB-8]|uniref:Uncharacterized protein n=1 Tax=Paraflavisolibacter caeni TaxID=2982496 RepID=A0A9X2XV59_9BACT|nr:hypothetical protein [Paraflavisolibacter caeni]MCU7549889.1 hypothetical protein [Paraflavisolibacter caeni]